MDVWGLPRDEQLSFTRGSGELQFVVGKLNMGKAWAGGWPHSKALSAQFHFSFSRKWLSPPSLPLSLVSDSRTGTSAHIKVKANFSGSRKYFPCSVMFELFLPFHSPVGEDRSIATT